MNHRVKGKKFNRNKASRKALLTSLAINFFKNEKIETTLVKAKVVRSQIEKMITTAKESTLANRRQLISKIQDKELVEKLLSDIGPRYKKINGGYTRIQRTNIRKGDGTQLAVISLVEAEKPSTTKKSDSKSKPEAETTKTASKSDKPKKESKEAK